MQEIDGVVFDLDGVLIDSRPVIEGAWRAVAARHGRVVTAAEAEQLVHGRSGAETVVALFPGLSADGRAAVWAEVDRVEEEARYAPVPGAVELVRLLAGAGVPLGLATSSWTRKIDNALGGLGLLELLPVRVTRDDVDHGKPHPAAYLTAGRLLGVPPERVLVFEDSLSGVHSAVAAGAVCVGVGVGGSDLLGAGAVALTPDLTGLGLAPGGPGRARLTGLDARLRLELRRG
ncbi:HAD family hydrolase [Kitasatospora sp. McL0602]|uniref:HAD family hydrolase n=1 Tax=Kitasatospora sp. McL0602 TaxID=3439530 RepID=UPI003F8CC66F